MLVISLAGCGKSDGIVPVKGVLTFKGKPVTNAWIDFMPEGGRMSSGQTDDQGHFKLAYDANKPGAMIGKHKLVLPCRASVHGRRTRSGRVRRRKPPDAKRVGRHVRKVQPGQFKKK